MYKSFRNSLLILTLCCGGLVDPVVSANSEICQIASSQDSATELPAVRGTFSSMSFELLMFGIVEIWTGSIQIREHLLSSQGNCVLTVYIRSEDVEAVDMIRNAMKSLNIDNWKTECEFINVLESFAVPTISFQKLITAIITNRDAAIPEEWFNGESSIAELQIPVLPMSKKFELSCIFAESFTHGGFDYDFGAHMNVSIHLAGCPDGKYGSSCSSDCACAEGAVCDTFNGCIHIGHTQVTGTSMNPDPTSPGTSSPAVADTTINPTTSKETPSTSETSGTPISSTDEPQEMTTSTQEPSTTMTPHPTSAGTSSPAVADTTKHPTLSKETPATSETSRTPITSTNEPREMTTSTQRPSTTSAPTATPQQTSPSTPVSPVGQEETSSKKPPKTASTESAGNSETKSSAYNRYQSKLWILLIFIFSLCL